MRISSIKEIMSNEKLQMELEKICTQADFEMLCKKYDFSGIKGDELDESSLTAVCAGVNPDIMSPSAGKWLMKIIEIYG